MKNNPLVSILVGVLVLGAAVTFLLAVRCELKVRQLNRLQEKAFVINNINNTLKALADETMEYSKRNPAITPILQGISAPPVKPAPQPPAKPLTK